MNSLTYRDQTRRAKGLLELKLASGVKGNNRDFYKCMVSKRKTRETVGPTAQGSKGPSDKGHGEGLNAFFSLAFLFICSQAF